MSTTTPNMGMVLPDEDGSPDIWDLLLNTALFVNDAHDHSPGKGVRIKTNGIQIDADLSCASGGVNYSLTDLKAIDFTPVPAASTTGYASALFVNSSDANNLYFRNQLGTAVKITDGSTLNVSIVGGIGGDYSTIGALVDFDDATDTYRMRQQTATSVRQYGKIAVGDIKLFEYLAAGAGVVPVNAVTLKSPAALGTAYALTMPAVLPATTSLMRGSSTGVLALSGNVDEDLTFNVNRNVITSGTGKFKFGEFSRMQLFTALVNWSTGSWSQSTNATGVGDRSQAVGGAGAVGWCELRGIDSYNRFNSILINGALASGAGNVTYDVMRMDLTGQVVSVLSAPVVGSGADATISNFSAASMSPTFTYYLKATMPGGGSYALYNVTIKYQPA